MKKNAVITIAGTQQFADDPPETIELVTQGHYRYEPGYAELSYVETQMTGLEGVLTTFTVEEDRIVTLTRTGKIRSEMRFEIGKPHDSLYDTGFAALLLRVCATRLTVLLNAHGGLLDLEYDIELEHTACGINRYHIEVRCTDPA